MPKRNQQKVDKECRTKRQKQKKITGVSFLIHSNASSLFEDFSSLLIDEQVEESNDNACDLN